MAGEVFVDALPYIDQGYDEQSARDAALALVEEETRRYRPTKNYLEHLPPLNLNAFETELMRNEFERLSQRLPMDTLSMKRYELPPPPTSKMSDISAWNECLDNSMAQLEHQATRICNLELMLEYGCEAWRAYIELLMRCVQNVQKKVLAMRKEVQDINWQRKNAQLKAGDRLQNLEVLWQELVKKNYEIEQACMDLENQISLQNKSKQHST